MKATAQLRVVESSGVGASAEFGISVNDTAHIMTILRDTLYSDKVLAVLREYGSNAWDAHRMVGKHDLPIKVTLPTDMDPTLSIRDFGPGMSHKDVFEIYTQYGASTKRETNDQNGMLGIGCKSAFAYSDSFTITSFHGGMKRTYVAVLDASDKGLLNLLHEEPSEETGILIQVAIKPTDRYEFISKAKEIFKYFNPQPDINCELEKVPASQANFKNGAIFEEHEVGAGWVAVMGCVPYKVDLTQLKGFGTDGLGVADFFHNLSGVVYFNLGDLQINASREGLKYNDATKNKLVDRFNALIDEYVSHIVKTIDDSKFTMWEKRFAASKLAQVKMRLTGREWLVDKEIYVKDCEHKEFTLTRSSDETVANIALNRASRLILRDNRRQLKSYHLQNTDYLITPTFKTPWSEVEKAVTTFCDEVRITGIPIIKLSTLPLSHRAAKKYESNVNHRRRTFVLKSNFGEYYSKNSEKWLAEDREPSESDVFVLLYFFEVPGQSSFYRDHKELLEIAEFFHVELPPIYGYKTTDKVPVKVEDIPGTGYYSWRKDFLRNMLTPSIVSALNYRSWSGLFDRMYMPDKLGVVCKRLQKELGNDHPLTFFFRSARIGNIWTKRKKPGLALLSTLEEELQSMEVWASDAVFLQKMLKDKYKLIYKTDNDFRVFGKEDADLWIHYVKSVDSLDGTGVNQ